MTAARTRRTKTENRTSKKTVALAAKPPDEDAVSPQLIRFTLDALAALCPSHAIASADTIADAHRTLGTSAILVDRTPQNKFTLLVIQCALERDRFSAEKAHQAIQAVSRILDLSNEVPPTAPTSPALTTVKHAQRLIREGLIPDVRIYLCGGTRWDGARRCGFDLLGMGELPIDIQHISHDDIARSLQPAKSVVASLRLSQGMFMTSTPGKTIGFAGFVPVGELAELVQMWRRELFQEDALLDARLRTSSVYRAILATLLSPHHRGYFAVYNRGITMLCRELDWDEGGKELEVKDLLVTDGRLTCKAIAAALQLDPSLGADRNVAVHVRLFWPPNDGGILEEELLAKTRWYGPRSRIAALG